MEHREADAEPGTLAGGWWEGERQFCSWVYNRDARRLTVRSGAFEQNMTVRKSDASDPEVKRKLAQIALHEAQRLRASL